ncbi:MAG: hypothetical protein QOJ50_2351 [Cryptosporangiaceae bacterium]|jgi:undecaprenyl-diphosphatase|nr:hypothetical protein [Cryptosporangiaceae bacterium]
MKAVRAAGRADALLFRRIAERQSPILDTAMPALSHAADHGRLWLGIAAGLYATGDPAWRRAAVAGVVSLAIASAAANGLAKSWIRRARPPIEHVPALRRVIRTPVTTSFPSGHAASAAAFATGAALAAPGLAIPLGVLAGAVAFSRIWTGAHYPLDVVAGVALGGSLARASHPVLARRYVRAAGPLGALTVRPPLPGRPGRIPRPG